MAQFFEKIEAVFKGKQPPEFFSDHPNPEQPNRARGRGGREAGRAGAGAELTGPIPTTSIASRFT
ncbi:MAG: hypothetical protein DMG30_07285 [Acidobacteria bacterium]|nr:MAG: hypothetical protein DMG30_07285 [Acidobacteriota bacterium]